MSAGLEERTSARNVRSSSAFKRMDDTVKNNEAVERRGKKTMINLFQAGAGSDVLKMNQGTCSPSGR